MGAGKNTQYVTPQDVYGIDDNDKLEGDDYDNIDNSDDLAVF